MSYQKHENIPRGPAAEPHSVIKPWPFRGWAMDAIGEIHPKSSRGHSYVLVAPDYFTKWVEAIPLKWITQDEVICFIQEHIIYRFGLPQSITVDRATTFNGEQVQSFANEYGFEIVNSTPYYAQANGQAESTNKVIKNNI